MKSVLISIQPKWCELIANGKKTIEVRKTKPKLDTPFKVYIYCTEKDYDKIFCIDKFMHKVFLDGNGKQKVIGEFVCDFVDYVRNYGDMVDSYDCIASCLSAKEIIDYAKDKNGNFVYTYGWHISDLKIYDKPKELSEFYKVGYNDMKDMEFLTENCEQAKYWKITRPPQSWCYVEELE